MCRHKAEHIALPPVLLLPETRAIPLSSQHPNILYRQHFNTLSGSVATLSQF